MIPNEPYPHAALNAATLAHCIAAGMLKEALLELFRGCLSGTRATLMEGADELAWFISKKATALINTWLNNKGMAVLHMTQLGLGAVVISRERVAHVLQERTRKDGVSEEGVEELLAALFIHGRPKYAPHSDSRKYPHQLMMVEPNYKAATAGASGESPVAALQWRGHPTPHLRLETAYWAHPAKTKALDRRALKK